MPNRRTIWTLVVRFRSLSLAMALIVLSGDSFGGDAGWSRLNPLPAGAVLRGAYFQDSLHAWFVGAMGAVVTTTDGGVSWKERILFPRADLERIHFVDDLHGIIVGGNNGGVTGAIFTTSDGGANWVDRYDDAVPNGLYDLSFRAGLTGWAAGELGLLKTEDGGVTWAPNPSSGLGNNSSVFFLDDSLGWATKATGKIFRTTDGGASWTESADMGFESLRRIRFATPLVGWVVGGRFYESKATIFKTTNGGWTWVLQDSLVGQTFNDLYVKDALHAWAVGTGGAVHYTVDGGGLWFTSGTNNADDYHQILFVDGKPWIVGGGEYHGTILTSGPPGFLWIEKNSSITREFLSSAAFEDDHTGWIGGANGSLFRTSDRGEHWTKIPLFGIDILSLSAPAAGHLYAGGSSGTFIRTTDAGGTWSVSQIPGLYTVASLRFADSLAGWALSDYSDLMSTTDGGASWASLSQSGTKFSFADRDHGILSRPIVTSALAGDEWSILYRTTNGGSTWAESTLSVGVTDLALLNAGAGWLLTSDAQLLGTTDGGLSWTLLSTFAEPIRRIAFTTPQRGWALGTTAIYATSDGGVTFTLSRYLNYATAPELSFQSRTLGFVLGDGGSILRYYDPATAISPDAGGSSRLPATAHLEQNYPNPFNPETRIRFEVPAYGRTVLTVFDLLGRAVAVLLDQALAPGAHETRFEAARLPAGVYFYRLESAGTIETKKLLLLK